MNARVKIGRVWPKSGGVVHVMTTEPDANTAMVTRDVRQTLANHGLPVAGYAFVVWDDDGGSTAAYDRFKDCPVPTPLLPEFVRTRMVLAISGRWAREDWNFSAGLPPDEGA